MRYKKRGRKLTQSHRLAMVRNLVTNLFVHGHVITTPTKAKEARPFAEKLITLAKDGSLHARCRAISLLHDQHVVCSLFSEIGPRYKERPGDYSRILHLAKPRLGDGAPQVLIELVEEEMESKAKAAPAVATVATTAAKAEEAPSVAAAEDAS
jgi:large subunit ribosomal protein L17